MKKFALIALVTSLATAAHAAPYVSPDDNLSGVSLCIDNNSFTAEIGALGTTSAKVAQNIYDYFVSSAKAQGVQFSENGDKACVDYAVDLSFEATVGNPRAWAAEIWVSDDGAYASLNAADLYKNPVVVWTDYNFGVLVDNDGIGAYLTAQGEDLVDSLLAAYKKVNK